MNFNAKTASSQMHITKFTLNRFHNQLISVFDSQVCFTCL